MNATPAGNNASNVASKPRRPWLRLVLLGLAGLIIGGATYVFAVVLSGLKPRGAVATGYMARVACACHFIGGRSLEQCNTDKEPGMEAVRLALDAKSRRVKASIPMVASASATHTPGLGCALDK